MKSTKPRILFTYRQMVSPKFRDKICCGGGAQRRLLQLVKSLIQTKKYDVYLASDDCRIGLFNEELLKNNIHHIHVHFNGWKGIFLAWIEMFFILLVYKINLVNANDRRSALASWVSCFLLKRLYVFTARAQFHGSKILRLFFGHNIIALCNGIKKHLISYFSISPSKISIIYNGITIPKSDDNYSNELRLKYLKDICSPVLLSVGRLDLNKNINSVISALSIVLKKHPDCQYWIVGDGIEKSNLIKQANLLGISDQVKFFGFQENPFPFYHAATIVINSSKSEGFPGSVLEASLMGKPLLCSRIDGTTEIINDGENGLLFSPGNIDEIANGIVKLLDDYCLRARLGNNAQLFSQYKFTHDKMICDYILFFDRLLSS